MTDARQKSLDERIACYRGWVMTLACEMYNDGDEAAKQFVAGLLHMGDRSHDYAFLKPPEKLTEEDIAAAMDAVFEKGGI